MQTRGFSSFFIALITMSLTSWSSFSTSRCQAQNIGFGGLMQDQEAIEESLLDDMKLEIDAMRRTADLPEKTILKLEVAAEQAIKSALKARPPVNLGNIGFPAPQVPDPKKGQSLSDEEEETKAKKDEEKTEKKERPDAAPGLAGVLQGLRNQVDVASIKQEEAWTKAVQSSLSEEQQAKWKELETSRAKALRRTRVETKVQELDSDLVLTESQRTQMTEVVDRVLGDDLVKIPLNKGGFGGGAGNVVIVMAAQGGKDLTDDDLAPILSPLQMKQFKKRKDAAAVGPFGMANPKGKADANKKKDGGPVSSGLGFTYVETPDGLKVDNVEADSRASRAGVRVGDILDAVDESAIDNVVQLKRALQKAGRKFVMTVKRDGQNQQLEFDGKK